MQSHEQQQSDVSLQKLPLVRRISLLPKQEQGYLGSLRS